MENLKLQENPSLNIRLVKQDIVNAHRLHSSQRIQLLTKHPTTSLLPFEILSGRFSQSFNMPSYSSSRHSHSSSSRKNDVYLGGDGHSGSSSRRSKYVQEKKWFCAWCHFGPLDWTYDTSCVECGRPRDQYCRVEYQTRKVRVT